MATRGSPPEPSQRRPRPASQRPRFGGRREAARHEPPVTGERRQEAAAHAPRRPSGARPPRTVCRGTDRSAVSAARRTDGTKRPCDVGRGGLPDGPPDHSPKEGACVSAFLTAVAEAEKANAPARARVADTPHACSPRATGISSPGQRLGSGRSRRMGSRERRSRHPDAAPVDLVLAA